MQGMVALNRSVDKYYHRGVRVVLTERLSIESQSFVENVGAMVGRGLESLGT